MYQLAGFDNDLISQITAPYLNGLPGPNWANDCGETCDAMVLKWALNINVEPEVIKNALYGPNYLGYGYVGDISNYLNRWGITTYYEAVSSAEFALGTVRGWLSLGHPVIVLLYANRQQQLGGHFVVAVGTLDNGGVRLANPWGGYLEDMSPAAWEQAYNGWLIHVEHAGYVAPAAVPVESQSSGVQGREGSGTIGTTRPGKFLVLTTMEARTAPDLAALREPVQLVNRGAVLDGTGKFTPHWVQVVAGGHPIWLYDDPTHLKRVS